jgi:predicted ATP-dependent protease
VGGITEKVEGFFGICSQQELTGEHGVIIPRQNIKNLILPEEIEAALKDRRFHLYPVDTLNDVLEILSGLPAGVRGSKGAYPPDSFNYHVEKRLRQLHALVKRSDD